MKIFYKGVFLLTFFVNTLAAAAGNIVISRDEVELLPQKPGRTFTVSLPENYPQCFLKLDARLLHPKRMRGGSNYALQVVFNGENLDNRRLVNYPNNQYFRSVSGSALYIYSKVHRMYRINYSPDFAPFSKKAARIHNPEFAPEYPYTLVFDISDLVRSGQENKLLLINKVRNYPFTVFCSNIELLSDFQKQHDSAGAMPSGKLPGIIVPRKDFAVDYRCVWDRGALKISVNNDLYTLNSRFSEPGGKWNSFAGGSWQVKVRQNDDKGIVLEGKGKFYSIRRQIKFHPSRLEVTDTFTNHSGQPLGIICANSISDNGSIDEIRISGRVIPSMNGTFNEQVRNSENPTVYVKKQHSGLGLFVRDDVFRANLMLEAAKRKHYGVKNRRLVLAPGGSYTATLDIYPTNAPDYYDFVNAARAVLGVNFEIDGNLSFAHGFDNATGQLPEQKFRDFIRFNRPRYVGLNSMRGVDSNGKLLPANKLSNMTWGTVTLLNDKHNYTRAGLLEAKRRFLAVDPELQFVVYHDCFLGAFDDPEKRYSDSSLWYYPAGKLVRYVLNGSRMIPRSDNQWGRDLQKVYTFLKENRLGLFWDESTAEPYFAANYWDGYTGEIDPVTFQLKKKIRNVVLDTLQFRLALLEDFRKHDLPVWCNFMPATESMTRRKAYRFVEGHDPQSALRTHFYTPISWGSAYTEVTEEDITDTMKNKLANGGLFMYYSAKFTSDNNFMQKLYPFTPCELHSGYIIGREKILTMLSGRFSWNDNSPISVEIYDKTGHLTTRKTPVKKDSIHGNYAEVDLQDGEFAIIYRNNQQP